ncbi:MAG: DinB family protein [Phycisphaerales bacterium]
MAASKDTVKPFIRLMLSGAFAGKGWQGPTLSGSLRGLSAREALARPIKGRKCIWEQVLHATFWKHVVLRAVTGVDLPSLGLSPPNWPRVPKAEKVPAAELERLWKADRARLARVHAELVAEVERLSSAAMWKRSTPDRRFHRAFYLAGMAAHDAYHTGQINLLKRVVRTRG